MLTGEREPQTFARHRDKRCKHGHETIAKALEGHWREEHLFALRQAVEQYDFVQEQLRACDTPIEEPVSTRLSRKERWQYRSLHRGGHGVQARATRRVLTSTRLSSR
jgi:hypothetical protein